VSNRKFSELTAAASFANGSDEVITLTSGVVKRATIGVHIAGLSALSDPNADRLYFWDESANTAKLLQLGSTLAITDTTIDVNTIAQSQVTGLVTALSDLTASIASAVAGLKWKTEVRAATTATGTLATAFADGQTVDDVTLATGDRILLKNQSTGSQNGIYTVNASGAPTRATDADSGTELVSAAVFVRSGTTNADKAFVCTNDTITLESTSIVFTAFATTIGAMIGANNLSDVANAATARTNLGVPGIAVSNTFSQQNTFNGNMVFGDQLTLRFDPTQYDEGLEEEVNSETVKSGAGDSDVVINRLLIWNYDGTEVLGFIRLYGPLGPSFTISFASPFDEQDEERTLNINSLESYGNSGSTTFLLEVSEAGMETWTEISSGLLGTLGTPPSYMLTWEELDTLVPAPSMIDIRLTITDPYGEHSETVTISLTSEV
jgi:hypothetical protein